MSQYPIPDTDLSKLVETSVTNTLIERRTDLDSRIRGYFKRYEILIEEEKKAETTLKKIQGRRMQISGRIDRLRTGDWAVLQELEKDFKPETQQGKTVTEIEA